MSGRNDKIKLALQEEKKARNEMDYYKKLYKDKMKTRNMIISVLGLAVIIAAVTYFFTKINSGTIAGLLFILLVCVVVIRRIYLRKVDEEVVSDLYERYHLALRNLSKNPKDVQLRQQALSTGRFYYSSTHPDNKPTTPMMKLQLPMTLKLHVASELLVLYTTPDFYEQL